jgi:hypothetical protein
VKGGQHNGDVANISQGASARASSWGSWNGNDARPEGAIDGVHSNHENSWGGTRGEGDWLEIQLDRRYRVESVHVDIGYHSLTYSVKVSTDGESWATVVSEYESPGDHYVDEDQQNNTAFDVDDDVEFVRIEIEATNAPGGHIWQAIIEEVDVYPKSGSSTETTTAQRTTQTPTPDTPTPTKTSTEVSTATSTRKTTESSDFDLRAATSRTEVRPIDESLFVLSGIPSAGERVAVVTQDYRLVDSDTARDALVTYVEGESERGFDWNKALSYAREMQEMHRRSEILNRAADVGWDALAAYAMSALGPTAAMGPALEALEDSISWAASEVDDPYKEVMSKQTQWTYTYRELEHDLSRADRLSELTEGMQGFVSAGLQLADSGRDLANVVSAAQSAYNASSSFTTSLASGGVAASSALYFAAVGVLVSRGVQTITGGFEQNAKLSAIGHSYSTTRIPMIRRIQELHEKRRNYELSPCEAWELAYLVVNHHYAGAFANQGMYVEAHALEQSTAGGIWNLLVNVDGAAATLKERASSLQWGGAAAHYDFGRKIRRANELAADSINAETHGSPTAIGVEP